jgi:hypothetical protein
MIIQVSNSQLQSLTFVTANQVSVHPNCNWNEITPEQESSLGHFVITDLTGFDYLQTPENDLYQTWNRNGKFFSSSYFGTRLLGIGFINQNFGDGSFTNVFNTIATVLCRDDEVLSMKCTDIFGTIFTCTVVVNSMNNNDLEDKIVFEMLEDRFVSYSPVGNTFTLGNNEDVNGNVRATGPSLQFPLEINAVDGDIHQLEYDRDYSNLIDYNGTDILRFTVPRETSFINIKNQGGNICYITLKTPAQVGQSVAIDFVNSIVMIDELVVNSTFVGNVTSGEIYLYSISEPTPAQFFEKGEALVIYDKH